MSLAINIDASDYITQSSLSSDEISGFKALLLDRLADGFKEQWINQINENLHSTRPEYMKAMFVDRPSEDVVVMGVTARKSKLALMLELGAEAFDEKQAFEQSSKKTMKKDGKGWFITIPFRHAVPSSVGESSVFSSVLPMSVYKLAKESNKGLKLKQLPSSQQVKTIRPAVQVGKKMFGAYQHKAARYEGLVRVEDRDENRSQYMTFRRVSDLTDQNAFIHPGFLPRNLLGKALQKTDISSIIRKSRIDFFKNRM